MAKKSKRDGEGKSDDSSTEPHFNLLYAPWIPVLWRDGRAGRVGISTALKQAGRIRQIAATNPMDNVALLRFLLAVLLWCKPDAKEALGKLLDADAKAPGIPEDWLGNLDRHQPAFELLGPGERFYQDSLLQNQNSRPIADLLVEFPGADSVNHMLHVVHDDGSYGFCPGCCVLGILRLSTWAPSNRYYPASVNPGSAAYAFTQWENLLATLRINAPNTPAEPANAPWILLQPPTSPDAISRLAWRPRKLWLNVAQRNGSCAYCGTPGVLLDSVSIEGGWPTPVTGGQQLGRDVLAEFQKLHDDYKAKKSDRRRVADAVVKAAPVIIKCRMASLQRADTNAIEAPESEADAAKIARVFEQLFQADDEESIKKLTKKATKDEQQGLSQDDTQVKKFWVEDPHLLKEAEAIGLPDLNADVGIQSSRFWRDALRLRSSKAVAVGPVVNKFTFQDATSVDVPGASANATKLLSASKNAGDTLRGLVKFTTPKKDRQHPEIHAATVLLTPEAERQAHAALAQEKPGHAPSTSDADKQFLRDIYQPVVEQVVDATAKGSPLRRRVAKQKALYLLNKNIDVIVDKTGLPAAAVESDAQEKPDKRDRSRKKKKEGA